MQARVKYKINQLLRQGMGPRQLAWSLAGAFLLGIFPIVGTCNLLVAVVALRFKLNLALMVAVSYVVYPVQMLLFVPFVHLGEYVFNARGPVLTWAMLQSSFERDIMSSLAIFGQTLLYASTGWLLVSLALLGLFYFPGLPVMRFFYRRVPVLLRRERPSGEEIAV